MFQQKRHLIWRGLAVPFIIFLLFWCFLVIGVKQVDQVSSEEQAQLLHQALIRATISCYAVEGMYPPDVAYLEEHYGVVIDPEAFAVYYQVFASNMLPQIQVISLYD